MHRLTSWSNQTSLPRRLVTTITGKPANSMDSRKPTCQLGRAEQRRRDDWIANLDIRSQPRCASHGGRFQPPAIHCGDWLDERLAWARRIRNQARAHMAYVHLYGRLDVVDVSIESARRMSGERICRLHGGVDISDRAPSKKKDHTKRRGWRSHWMRLSS
jgi:hypothetical protein